MTLLQALLEQRLFLLILGTAAGLLVFALILAIASQARAALAARKLRKRERTAHQAVTAEQSAAQPEAHTATPASGSNSAASSASVTAAAHSASTANPASAAQAPPPATPAAPEAVSANQNPLQDGIKDLLSVFVEDANHEKRTALLKGLPLVDINDLVVLCQQTAEKMQSGAKA